MSPIEEITRSVSTNAGRVLAALPFVHMLLRSLSQEDGGIQSLSSITLCSYAVEKSELGGWWYMYNENINDEASCKGGR